MSTYSFVSRHEEVNSIRMVREAPFGTPFILFATKSRKNNKPLDWTLLVNVQVLENDNVSSLYKEHLVLNAKAIFVIERDHVFSDWLVLTANGRIPGDLRVVLQQIQKELNPKNVVTEVTLCPVSH